MLLKGIKCPKVFGDPVLLLPLIIPFPKINKKYKLGIIPHYIDRSSSLLNKLNKLKNNKNVIIIDILSGENPNKIIKEISSCHKIISSSLHGIILGDAYNIPSYHVEFSDRVIGKGFKFKDYYLSVNRNYYKINFNANSNLNDILNQLKPYTIKLNLKKLIQVFPYIDPKIKKESLNKLNNNYMKHIHNP